MDNNSYETSFEKSANIGGNTVSSGINNAEAWSGAMSDAGEGPSYFGARNDANGEATSDGNVPAEAANAYNQDISDGANILNYGLNGAAAMLGVEAVINGIKTFNVSNSTNPIRDLYNHLGIDTKEEFKDLRQSQSATKDSRNAAYSSENAPSTMRRSEEGARKAIKDMQDLILAVEKEDDDYAELRDIAKKNNKNVFEQAITGAKNQDLASVFAALTAIKRDVNTKKMVINSKQTTDDQDQEKDMRSNNTNDNYPNNTVA